MMLIVGRNPILEQLKVSPYSVKKIIICQGSTNNKIKEIVDSAKRKNISIETMTKERFKEIFSDRDKSEGISQGMAAEVIDFRYSDESVIIDNSKDNPNALMILLDEIQDPHNLGAIIRTSSAAGCSGIIITEKNSAKVNHTVIKTSSGTANSIPIALTENIYQTIENLKKSQFKLIGTSLNTTNSLYKYLFEGKTAIVLGNEGEGLRKNILKLCNDIIKIPVSGKTASLNVSVSAGVIIYEILRQTKLSKEKANSLN